MNGKHLLDTNIIVALFKGDKSVQTELAKSVDVFVSAIAIGELYFGAYHSSDTPRHLNQISEFSSSVTVLNCDSGTAERYGQIKHALKLAGNPIPENDIWIAAIARQYNLTVATRDKHFTKIADIFIANW